MKKIYNLILTAALMLGAVACEEELAPNLPDEQVIPEDARVTVTFGVPAEITTRAAMANEPTIESLHVFVFSKVGVLIEAVPARSFGAVTTNGVSGANFWVADLQMGAAERHLHFVANLPEDYELPTSGSSPGNLQNPRSPSARSSWKLHYDCTDWRYGRFF